MSPPSRLWSLAIVASLASGCGARTAPGDRGPSVAPPLGDAALDARDAPDARPPEPDVPPAPRELAWRPIATASPERPATRMGHFTLYEPATDSVLVIGGFDPFDRAGGDGFRRDVWRLDLASGTWRRVATLARPLLGYTSGGAILDADRRRVVLLATSGMPAQPHELLALDTTTWTLTPLPGGPWPAGWAPMGVGAWSDRRWLVAVGAVWTETVRGTWAFDLGTGRWSTLATDSPAPRSHVMLADGGDRVFLYGGYYGDVFRDLWETDPATSRWRERAFAAPLPTRLGHRVVVDRARNRLVAFGGYAQPSVLHEALLFIDLATGRATAPALSPAPAGRREHGFVLDARRRVVLFGGALDNSRCLDDAWELTLD